MPTDHRTPKINRRTLLAGTAALAAGLTTTAFTTGQATPANAPTNHNPTGRELTDTVLAALRNHRLAGLGEEPIHGIQEHHDVLQTALADPRLPEAVNDIVVEFANALYQDTIDAFILDGQPVADGDLRPIWRNTTQSPRETWDNPVYEQVFRRVRAINWALPANKRIRILAGDPPLDWTTVTDRSQIPLDQRDSHAASVIEQQVLAKGRRALLCYGGEHLFHTDNPTPSIVSLVEQHTGVRTYTIMDVVPLQEDPGGLATKLAQYARGTVIPTAHTWLGRIDAQYALPGKTVGVQSNFPYCGLPLGTLHDAGLYLGQPADLTKSSPNPAVYLDPTYWAELQRRAAIQGVGNLNTLRQEQPSQYPPLQATAAC